MPDAEVQAESSPVAESAEAPEIAAPEPQESLGIFDAEKPAPKEEAKPAAPEAEKEEESAASAEKSESDEGESAQPPEGAEQERSGRSNAETRIKQLTAQVRAMERQFAAMQQPQQAGTMRMAPPVRPDLETFAGTAEEYKSALDKYDQQARQFAIEQDRVQRKFQDEQELRAKFEKEALVSWDKRSSRLLKANPKFDARMALSVVQPNPTTDGFFVESEVGPEILHYLYENPDEADRIRDMAPYKAIRELVKLENRFADQIKGIKSKPAPKPPAAVTGRASAPAAPKTAADILYG